MVIGIQFKDDVHIAKATKYLISKPVVQINF